MCGVVPDPRGEGEISRHFSLLSLSYACKELLSDMMTVKPEFIHRWPRDSSVVSFLKCRVRNLVSTAYMTLLGTSCYWAVRTWFSKHQVYIDFDGDAMLVPIRMAAGNQQKYLSLSFATKA